MPSLVGSEMCIRDRVMEGTSTPPNHSRASFNPGAQNMD